MLHRWLTVLRLPAFLVVALLTLSGFATPVAARGLPRPDHVVIVVEENHSYAQIIGNSAAPYINSLAQAGALFTAAHGVTHPSLPNYLALFSGSTQGVHDDSCGHSFQGSNLATALAGAGLQFTGYAEGLPAPGSTVCTSGSYARKHNPWAYFRNVPAGANQPFSAFPHDYSTLPTVAMVVPNQRNDMHNGSIQQADRWLRRQLGGYAQWAQSHNSLLILTWDEDDFGHSNQIPTIFVGSMVQAGQYSESISHYSVLDTVEALYGVGGRGQVISTIWR
jgi:acid phosphatase